MNNSKNVSAIIVTYNKLDLLKECIESVRNQTYQLSHIIIVNNASTDGTLEFLEAQEDVITINMKTNLGGAGGFQVGVKSFFDNTTDDLCWIMDDDTIPDKTALYELISAANRLDFKFGFLSSFVYWKDGTPAAMNKPAIHEKWNDKLSLGIVRIKSASFVSLLTQRQWIKISGLPIGEFFIWGDDIEYTKRITLNEHSYLVPSSMVLHKMGQNNTVNIIVDDYQRVPRYVYSFRNRFYTAKCAGLGTVIHELLRNIYLIGKILLYSNDHKLLRIKQVIIGQTRGIRFNPKIEGVK